MEWRTPDRAKPGQHRERLKFAWWPIKCEDGKTRWLENVRILEEFICEFDGLTPTEKWETVKVYRGEVEVQSFRPAKYRAER